MADAPSMGPPPFGDGNQLVQDGLVAEGAPSMGPPPFGDGNRDLLRVEGHHRHPSMGPPPFGDGNRVGDAGQLPRVVPSGLYLQWGHRLSAMETTAGIGLLAAGITLQWGHRLSAMETGPPARGAAHPPAFNGATAFRRWKPQWQCPKHHQPNTFNGATGMPRHSNLPV